MSEKPSFWQTLPGVIAGIATILTAVVAILTVLPGNDSDSEPGDAESPSPTATATSRPAGGTGGGGDVTPVAVVAPKSLDFGRLGASRTAEQSVTLANTGTEYLVVEEAEISGRTEVFSVDAGSCLEATGIEPGSDCEITVTFTPGSPGSYAGSLDIEHSGPTSPTRVPLNGEGVLLEL